LNEADRIGQQNLLAVWQRDLPRGWIQRGEQAILGQHASAGKRVEQRGFAGIGVANQRHNRHAAAAPALAILLAVAMDLFDLAFQQRDPVADHPPVELQLGFAGPAQAYHAAGRCAAAAGLALEVQPLAAQARQQVLILCQLDLDAALVRARVGGEDIQDQPGSIEHLHLQYFLQVARLGRRQLIVEDHQIIFQLIAHCGDLFGLARPNEVLGEGPFEPLIDAADHLKAGGVGE